VIDDIAARATRSDPHPVRDDELRMMFTCAHPALDSASQLALTLRLISGLTVAEIARALLQSEARLAVEPAPAAAIAAAMGPLRERLAGKRVALVICGANIDAETYGRLLERGRRTLAG